MYDVSAKPHLGGWPARSRREAARIGSNVAFSLAGTVFARAIRGIRHGVDAAWDNELFGQPERAGYSSQEAKENVLGRSCSVNGADTIQALSQRRAALLRDGVLANIVPRAINHWRRL